MNQRLIDHLIEALRTASGADDIAVVGINQIDEGDETLSFLASTSTMKSQHQVARTLFRALDHTCETDLAGPVEKHIDGLRACVGSIRGHHLRERSRA